MSLAALAERLAHHLRQVQHPHRGAGLAWDVEALERRGRVRQRQLHFLVVQFAGAKLKSMLAMGASKPWPDAMEAITGQRKIDAGPMLEYFKPLRGWLAEQNKGKKCGW